MSGMRSSAVSRFLSLVGPSGPRAVYVGLPYIKNMGDTVLFHAFGRLFPELKMVALRSGKLVSALAKVSHTPLFCCTFLGGGTLINKRSFLKFAEVQSEYPPSFVVGSGAMDPGYWASRPAYIDCRAEWVEALRRCRLVGVRGPRSLRLLQEAGFKDAEVVGDTALYFAREPRPSPPPGKRLGVNIGISYGRVWGSEGGVLDRMVRFCRVMLDKGWDITLLPVAAMDLDYIAEAARRLDGRVTIFRPYQNFPAVLDLLENCQVFVGEKLHSVVFATCVNTPSVMLEYRPKCRDYMCSLDLEDYNVRTDGLDVDLLVSLVEKLHDERPAMSAFIRRKVLLLRGKLLSFAARIKTCLGLTRAEVAPGGPAGRDDGIGRDRPRPAAVDVERPTA